MKTHHTKKLLLTLFLCCGATLFSQNQYWGKTTSSRFSEAEILQRTSMPNSFKVFHLNRAKFSEVLDLAPLKNSNALNAPVVVEFPISDGSFQRFSITESPIMHPTLAAKYPQIKTYKAIGIDDPTATMRFSVTQFGLHAMKLSGIDGTSFIDPYTSDRKNYIIYNKGSLDANYGNFECSTDSEINSESQRANTKLDLVDTNDQKLRTYRLALSSTGEYSSIFAGSGSESEQKANVQAQMAITINRVNEIYERDLAITLQFVANNDDIIYLDAATDPWDNEYHDATQTEIDTTIGSDYYDIGHNFNTSRGGNAGCIGCVCTDGIKGRGWTGSLNPTGDAFDIDYVSHEMGHQFGGRHTMNFCFRDSNGSTTVEPGSGSSIMGYAGVCETNVQNNTDAHFNYVNIRDMQNNVQSGTSSACAQETELINQAPVADAGSDYTIPKSTPFILRGSATDADGLESLTYNWSQNDIEIGPNSGAPQPSWTVGPLYRAKLPITSPNRWMPQISDVVANNLTPTWEVTPSVARQMQFSFIVRDNGSGFPIGTGQTSSDLMNVTVEDSDPFVMTAPNTAVTWNVASTETVTWDVGQTDNVTINCQTVQIKLSIDGGMTYPILLSGNTPNDGTQAISIPDHQTTTARIMVEAADNIFYDISDMNFTIGASLALTEQSIDNFVVVPNPSNGQFGFKLPTLFSNDVNVLVYDLHGRAIYKKEFTNETQRFKTVALTNVSPGMYFLNVSDGVRSVVKRIIVK